MVTMLFTASLLLVPSSDKRHDCSWRAARWLTAEAVPLVLPRRGGEAGGVLLF